MFDYSKMKVAELKKICKDRKIPKYYKLKKGELVALLNRKDAEKQKSQTPKPKTPSPVKEQEPPMPASLQKDTTGFEDMIKQEQKDEVLSDLDEMLDNYDEKEAEEERLRQEEEERLQKEEEERKRMEAEEAERKRKEEEEKKRKEEEEKKRKEEEERKRKEEEERKRKEAEEKRMKEEMLRKLEEMKRQEEEKQRKQQIQAELSKYDTVDIVAFLKSQGYNVFKQQQAKYINKKQTAILRNTIDDLDLLSDDEE